MNKSEWNKALKQYARPSLLKSSWQLINTLIPYVGLNGLMLWMLINGASFLWYIPAAALGGLLMVRLFILFHDCTHQSFFKSRWANSLWGHLLGILTYTPFYTWQHEHNMHHGTVGNLDRRGIGDVWTMTVEEYLSSTKGKQLVYRLYRNPFFLFIVAPFFLFGVLNRFPRRRASTKELLSYLITDVGLALVFGLFWWLGGWYAFFLVQLPQLFFASVAGVWLFFVQHQFEEVYWSKNTEWDMVKAALEGSSFYRLPKVLNWFTGSIGFHHIHHLNSRIPNYNLVRCFRDITALREQKPIKLLESFRLALFNLYDEQAGRMTSFRRLRKRRKTALGG